MKAKKADWISLIEAGYCLEGDDQQWIDQVFDCAKPLFDPAGIPDAWTYSVTPTTFALGIGRTSPASNAVREKVHEAIPSAAIDVLYRNGWVVATGSEYIPPLIPNQFELFRAITNIIGHDASDVWGVKCSSGAGSGVVLAVVLAECRNSTAKERKLWSQVAAHLGAGLRLRKLAQGLSLDASSVEAVFDSRANLHDARAQAVETKAQETLRQAVRRIEHSRTTTGHDDPDTTLDNWQGLVDGRWSLVDHFDTDGKRFVVAIKNDPAHPDPRGLTQRERQIAEYIGMGYSTKEIAYVLGVSDATIINTAARTQNKLCLSSRAEVASFFAPNGLRQKLTEVAVKDERLLVGAYPLIDPESVSCLTETEREVAAQIIAGSTNSDIAERRGLSERTVANQVQSIFVKLHVHSRAELAARLQARDSRVDWKAIMLLEALRRN
ncbi:MAG: LuxR C-terminal-related transcriptional regulator [Methylocystis sp.]